MKGLLALLLVLAAAAPGAAAAAGLALAVDSAGMTVSDLDRSAAFYTEVLGFEPESEPVETWGTEVEHLEGVFGARILVQRLRLGDETIELTQYLAPEGRLIPADSRANDRWFQHIAIIVSDMERAYRRLRQHKVRHAASGPQRLPDWNPKAGGIEAFYFKDPDGHTLEILAFPPEKGDPKWHRKTGRLFLGIDHTAIVVEDTGETLRFYRDLLGLEVAGGSENHGFEQEHLNGVFGARLRITTLRAAAGPKIELLEYLAPRDGRPYPADARANDLVHWQTRLRVPDAAAAATELAGEGYTLVSPGAVELPDDRLGFRAGVMVRDPDGHAIQLAGGATDGEVRASHLAN